MANSRPANVRSHRRGGGRGRTSPWLAASIALVLVLGGMTAGYVYLVHRSCTGKDHALIAASEDITPILESLNKDWASTKPAVGGRCVSVTIEARDSALMATELGARSWDPSSTDPAPDVWVPESSVWIRQAVAAAPDAEQRIPDLQPSLARTPTVVAMPRSMATAIGWPDSVNLDWTDLAGDASNSQFWKKQGHAEWGRFHLDMTNPTTSTAGLLALMAIADADGSGDIDAAEQAGLLTLKQSMNKGGYLSNTSDIIAKLSNADASSSASALQTVSAFPALEQDVIQYNRTDPKEPLVAIYPKSGSYDADHPYLILDAPWTKTNPGGTIAAKAFLTFARGTTARKKFLEAGFRDSNRIGGSLMTQANGVTPLVGPLPRAILSPDSVDQTITRWTAVTRPTNVLIVLDVSGSMNNSAVGSKTRLDLAKAAAEAAVSTFSDDSDVGFWVFSGGYPGNRMYKELVPLGTLADTVASGRTRKDEMLYQISHLTAPGQQTGLYDTVAAAQADVVASYKPGATNLVVLMTDGHDEGSSIDLNALKVKLLKNRQSNHPVPVVTIAYGADADVNGLNQISRTSGTISLSAVSPIDINNILIAALFGAV